MILKILLKNEVQLICAVGILLIAFSCGVKGPPLPPIETIPQKEKVPKSSASTQPSLPSQ